jgi:hypothetical protein
MTESVFNELYPNMQEMKKALFRVMRGIETLDTKFLSDEENEILIKLSEKWINEFDKYKNTSIDNIIKEIDEL